LSKIPILIGYKENVGKQLRKLRKPHTKWERGRPTPHRHEERPGFVIEFGVHRDGTGTFHTATLINLFRTAATYRVRNPTSASLLKGVEHQYCFRTRRQALQAAKASEKYTEMLLDVIEASVLGSPIATQLWDTSEREDEIAIGDFYSPRY
jgi:hypothetical protein